MSMVFTALLVASSLPVFDVATNSIVKRLIGADPAICLSRFVDYPHAFKESKPIVANPAFWLKGVDFSCASPWNDSCGATRAGTLISKRHIVFAQHFPLWKGCRVLFVDQNGDVCPSTIKSTKRVGMTDIMIGALDYEVTPNIRPAKILPDNFAKYIGDGKGLPIVTLTQDEMALLAELRGLTKSTISNALSTNSTWVAFGGRVRRGDSGNPAFLIIDNDVILLYCLFGGGVGHGYPLHAYRREIQAAMDELCPGYKLECFDFKACSATSAEK